MIPTCRSRPPKSWFRPSLQTGNNAIRATLPYVRQDIPIFIIFRAMGILPDEDILSLICYDLEDDAFTDMLKPSVEEGHGYQTQDVSDLCQYAGSTLWSLNISF
jgi:DNA-directed RNA polymerase II subunit RPB2